MRSRRIAVRLIFSIAIIEYGAAPGARAAQPVALPVLNVATYDSFVAKDGLGPEIFALFEKKCGCKIQATSTGDGAQLLSKLELGAERGHPPAHVVLGLDQTVWSRAKPYLEDWGSWRPTGYDRVPNAQKLEPGFLPFDYGVFAFMEDHDALVAAHLSEPQRLMDLLKPEWRRQLILEDPRTSLPGLALVLYVDAVAGETLWSRLRTQWLTLAPGWDGAYGLFLKKEAPLVWSYTTSQAYHRAHGDGQGRYRAIVFEEGNPMQLEGAALVKGATEDNPKLERLARDFLAFLLSPEVQSLVPSKNWMLPVIPDTPLPASFADLPKARKIVKTPTDSATVDKELASWKQAIGTSP